MWCPTRVNLRTITFLDLYQWPARHFKAFLCQFFLQMTLIFLCTGPNLKDFVYQINQEIRMIYLWVKANKLSLNIYKTYFMLFTPKWFPRNMDNITIGGKQIIEVNETKFLWVIIDNDLNWKPHITYIIKKVAKGIGIILKARKVFNNETLSTLYFTLVYPYLNYCIHVRGRAYNTHLKDLFVLQNKVIRIINGVPPRNNTEYLYIQCFDCETPILLQYRAIHVEIIQLHASWNV